MPQDRRSPTRCRLAAGKPRKLRPGAPVCTEGTRPVSPGTCWETFRRGSYSWPGQTCLPEQGGRESAIESYSQTIETFLEVLRQMPDHFGYLTDKGICLEKVADALVALGDTEAAMTKYSEALVCLDEVRTRFPREFDALLETGTTLAGLGRVQSQMLRPAEARESYQLANEILAAAERLCPGGCRVEECEKDDWGAALAGCGGLMASRRRSYRRVSLCFPLEARIGIEPTNKVLQTFAITVRTRFVSAPSPVERSGWPPGDSSFHIVAMRTDSPATSTSTPPVSPRASTYRRPSRRDASRTVPFLLVITGAVGLTSSRSPGSILPICCCYSMRDHSPPDDQAGSIVPDRRFGQLPGCRSWSWRCRAQPVFYHQGSPRLPLALVKAMILFLRGLRDYCEGR